MMKKLASQYIPNDPFGLFENQCIRKDNSDRGRRTN